MQFHLKSTPTFNKWIQKIKDRSVRNRIMARLNRIEIGNFGDCKQIDPNLYEMRFFFGGGLRIYYSIFNGQVVLLLAGGDKSTQSKDIATAKNLLSEMEG